MTFDWMAVDLLWAIGAFMLSLMVFPMADDMSLDDSTVQLGLALFVLSLILFTIWVGIRR